MTTQQPSARAALGKVGLPAPMQELAGKRWDAIIVGGGHNGLVTACYLAKAGLKVVVVEKNEWIGGAAVSRSL